MWDDPRDRMALNIRLEVDALDRNEDFSERLSVNDEVHELDGQSSALIQDSLADDFDVGESGEEIQHCQAIVEIGQRVLKSGISLLDDVIELVKRFRRQDSSRCHTILLVRHSLEFPQEDFVGAEFVDDGFVGEKLNVFGDVKRPRRRRTFVGLFLVLGFDGINAFEDT